MKIYFNTYPVAFQCPGGGEIQLLKSKEALERRGHDVILYNQWEHKLADADVVHHFSVQGGSSNFCNYVHQQRIPLAISPILWLSDYIDQYPMGEINHLLNIANVICPNSNAEIDRFAAHFNVAREKYIVTNNGVDSIFFNPVDQSIFREHFGIFGEFILCVGNIEIRKNQLALVQAAADLDLDVVLIGNIRDQGYFDDMAQKFSGKFSYLGFLDHTSEILRSAYAACSVFALPSLLETPGLAALEAAACGSKLVVTQEGCTEEYFGGYALYVDPKNVGDISGKLQEAMGQSVKTKLITGQLDFSWDKTAEQLEKAYALAIQNAHVSNSIG